MDMTVIKKEYPTEQLVKVEAPAESEVATVVQQDPDFGHRQTISSDSIPRILQNYRNHADNENVEIVQLEDGQYTYIIENPTDGAQFELADGEHYIIEEYQGEYEDGDDSQYETVYIQSVDSPNQDASDVYTIAEEGVDEDDQYDEDEDQMAIVEEVEEKNDSGQEKVSKGNRVNQPHLVSHLPVEFAEPHIKQEEVIYLEQDNTEQIFSNGNFLKKTQNYSNKSQKKSTEILYECKFCLKTLTPSDYKRHIELSHGVVDETQTKPVTDVLAFSLCPCCGEPSDSAHTTGDFRCDECSKLFIQQNSLDRHKSIEHPSGDNYECCECKKVFDTKDLLIDHSKVHSLKAVKCEDCGREFSRKYHLERHIGQTGCMGVPKQVYECRVCNKTFTRKDNLGEHLKAHAGIMHRRKKTYTCEFCMKEFSGLALLSVHVRTHTGERPYGCDICEKKFPSSGAMKKHRRKHTGEKPYTCSECGVKFAAKETLNRHFRTHTGDKPHQCKFCGKAFIQATQLRAHIFHHTGENAYTCPHCNRAFNRKLRLTTHIKYMHEGAAPLSCPQEGCSKTFFRKEDIHRHMLIHSGERPFKCNICDKAFTVKSSLKIHQNIHKKEQPVSCEVCSRAFIRRDCLMRHMRARHRDVLEDIVANAEKKRLQRQLLQAVSNSSITDSLKETIVWTELSLTESIKELLSLLVDEDCLTEFGHPEAPVDRVLESVIRRCGHSPALDSNFDYIGKLRENAKLLFTVVIDDKAVKELLNNQTVDEVIMHVLNLARKQASDEVNAEQEPEEIEVKPTIDETLRLEEGNRVENDEEQVDLESSNDGGTDEENTVEFVIEEDGLGDEQEIESEGLESAEES